jgi:hypothetical protein
MFRTIQVDHTNFLQVTIKTHSFIPRISTLRGGGGFVLVSQGCVTGQTFVEIEGKIVFPLFFVESLLLFSMNR